MTRPTFPTDPRFRRIAAAIADAVQLARAQHWRLSSSQKLWCHCPMGCFKPEKYARPDRRPRKLLRLGLTPGEFFNFTMGFDHADVGSGPFAELGREYRRRFP